MVNMKQIIKTLVTRRDAIGKERDKLRELLSNWADLAETCDSAYEDIDHAIDALSQYA